MSDVGLIPVWLFVIALVSIIQLLMLIVGAAIVWRMVSRLAETLDTIEHSQIVPLLTHVHGTLDDVRDFMSRARAADDDVRRVVTHTADAASRTAFAIRSRLRPAFALTRGVAAAVTTFTERRRRQVS